jgi:TFIIF-interacting CTD phosphatase-like protein
LQHLRWKQRWLIFRPGLPTFLEKMSEMYEMHVYTMGTRTYADAVCKAIDPDGKIFGGRILSRDESGSESLRCYDQAHVALAMKRELKWES